MKIENRNGILDIQYGVKIDNDIRALMWWPKIQKRAIITILSKIQKLAFLGNEGNECCSYVCM